MRPVPTDKPQRRGGLGRRLVALLGVMMVVPAAVSFVTGRSAMHDLGAASEAARRSYEDVQRSAKGAIENTDRLIALNALGVVSAAASHLEYVLRKEPRVLDEGLDLTEHPEIWSVIISQRLGRVTRVGLLDHRRERIVAHSECQRGAALAACMPRVARLLVDAEYRKKLGAADLGRTIGQTPGMAYQRLLEYGFYEAPDEDAGSRYFVALTPLRGSPWSFAIETSATGVFSEVYRDVSSAIGKTADDLRGVDETVQAVHKRQVTALGVVAALGATLLLASGWWVRRRVIRPLELLRATADRIRAGEIETCVVLRTGDEIEVLADSMDYMLRRIATSYRELEQRQVQLVELNASLEERVSHRTSELGRVNQELRLLDEMKRHFYTNVSHELRTPLTLILGSLRSLEGCVGGDPAAARDVAAAQRNAAQLLREINDLLDVARLEAGRMTLKAAPLDLRTLVRDVAANFVPAQGGGRTLALELPEKPQVLFVDLGGVRKVVFNLLANAIKFTDEKTGRVTVRVHASAEGVVLEVEDNGIGIADAELAHIFERFRQADGSTTRKYEGSGIGLALVKEIASLHGASVSVRSEVGVGSTFAVAFRTGRDHLRDADVADAPEASDAVETLQLLAAARPDVAPAPAGGDAGDILVVEDHEDLRAYLVRLLAKGGYRPRAARDGAEALERVREQVPELVVSDVMMPRIDGYELCATLKADPATSHVPVILLTAQTGLVPKVRGLESRADDYLTKPFSEEELVARVQNLLLIGRQATALRQQARELKEMNEHLQVEVLEQAEALQRRSRLGRFLPPAVADELLKDGAAGALERQRRTVAILSAELYRFEELASGVAPEDLTVLFGRFHTIASQAIFRAGGTIAALQNGSVQAVFGAPRELPSADAAVAAALAAAELLFAIDALAEGWRELSPRHTLVLHAGVDLGDATVGAFGDGEWASFAAVGGPAVHAPRLCEEAAPGEILVSGAAAAFAMTWIEPGGPRTVHAQTWSREVFRLKGSHARAAETVESGRHVIEVLTVSAGADPTGETREDVGGPTLAPSGALPAFAPRPGQVLGDRYEILRELGQGGMGRVFAARDRLLGETIAVKVLHGSRPEDLGRLRREVRLSRLVTHPNVCRVFDLQILEGLPCLTMELVKGRSLRVALQAGRVEAGCAIGWLRQLCDALSAAHACGIVHRDLKPDNVLVEDTGRVLIADFGIARPPGGAPVEAEGIVGTLDYLSPEQLVENASLDARADIYALGILSFELFTGRLPFDGKTPYERALARLDSVPHDPADLAPEIGPRLRAVILRCLQREAGARFQRIGDVAAALAMVVLEQAPAADPPARPPAPPPGPVAQSMA